jgi:hypothetical protein
MWGITTDHFDPNASRRRATSARAIPLEQVLVENSTYSRWSLKRRLFAEGLKQPILRHAARERYGRAGEWR